jgi:hypothetical protein
VFFDTTSFIYKHGPHLIWVGKFKLPAVTGPADEMLTSSVGQQLQQKLPQLDGTRACDTVEKIILAVMIVKLFS